ncbi:MAG: SufD family Fe-S cluster assembly protein [Bacilli bacterium]
MNESVLTLVDHDLVGHVFDEQTLPEQITKVVLKSKRDIDFVVVLRSKSQFVTYEVAPYTKGKILFYCEHENVEIKREIILLDGTQLKMIVPDFTSGNRLLNIETKLIGVDSRANWHLASFSMNEDKKKFKISFSHYGAKSFADMQNYGVVLNQSTLIFTGDSTIYEEVKGAETHQTARIIVFDAGSRAQADPILNIYHNDVIAASHAATVGRVNAEHLYYLNTRGLTENEAKQLITKGYLMPILDEIDDEGLHQKFSSLLEGVI